MLPLTFFRDDFDPGGRIWVKLTRIPNPTLEKKITRSESPRQYKLYLDPDLEKNRIRLDGRKKNKEPDPSL